MKHRTCITLGEVNKLLDIRTENPKFVLRECWISFNPITKHRIGIDNSVGQFRIEEFKSYEDCISWVKGEIEVY